MQSRLTRRKFLQKTLYAGSALSVAGFYRLPELQFFNSNTVSCNHCGFQTKRTGSQPLQNLTHNRFCPHCGIDTLTSSFPSDKKCGCNGTLKNNEKIKNPICCQVPFPAHGANTTKPILRMADLNF